MKIKFTKECEPYHLFPRWFVMITNCTKDERISLIDAGLPYHEDEKFFEFGMLAASKFTRPRTKKERSRLLHPWKAPNITVTEYYAWGIGIGSPHDGPRIEEFYSSSCRVDVVKAIKFHAAMLLEGWSRKDRIRLGRWKQEPCFQTSYHEWLSYKKEQKAQEERNPFPLADWFEWE